LGISFRCAANVESDVDVLSSLSDGHATFDQALAKGSLKFTGDQRLRPQLAKVFRQLTEVSQLRELASK
jgi:hypothetical protein